MAAKFCTFCGRPLETNGRCAYCAAKASASRPVKQPAKKKRRTLPVVLIILVVLLSAAVTAGILMLFGIIPNPFKKEADAEPQSADVETEGRDGELPIAYEFEHRETPPEYVVGSTIERPDARETLEEIGTIASETRFADSQTAQTEAEAYRDLTDRGFTQAPITTAYGADGTYTGEREISEASNERHPIYQTLFLSQDGAIWSIQSVNGRIVANPVSYNLGEYWDTEHLLSETGSCVRYDGATRTFFELVPDPSGIHIRTVTRIDAALLETMTAEEVDR